MRRLIPLLLAAACSGPGSLGKPELRIDVDARWFEKARGMGTLALDAGQVAQLSCQVQGLGMASPISVIVPAVDGRASFELDNVPIGTNRIVTVKGLDLSGQFLPGHELKSLATITPDQTATVSFSQEGTAMARVVEALLASGETFWATQLDLGDLANLIRNLSQPSAHSPGLHPSLLDAGRIAKAIATQQGVPLVAGSELKVPQAGRLRGVVAGFQPGTAVTVTCLDPASRPLTLRVPDGGRLAFSLEGVTPGRWSVVAKPAATSLAAPGFLAPLLLDETSAVGTLLLNPTPAHEEQILVVVNPTLGPRPTPDTINASVQLTETAAAVSEEVTIELFGEGDVTLAPAPFSVARATFQTQAVPDIGSKRQFWVLDPQGNEVQRTGVLRQLSSHALVYVDEQHDGLIAPDATQIGAVLKRVEEQIDPALRQYLGEASDIDRNGRVMLFFSPVTNFHVGLDGYFRGQDTLSETEANFFFRQHSNLGEVITLRFPRAGDTQYPFQIAGTVAHEMAHLISWSHHYPEHGAGEEAWLDEGIATLASDLCGVGFSAGHPVDVERVRKALQAPESWSLVNWQPNSDPAGYGVSYLFVRYLYDRFGAHWLKELVNPHGSVTGMPAVLKAIDQIGQPMPESASLLRDWAVALLMSDTGKMTDPRFRLAIRLNDSSRLLSGLKVETLSPSQSLQIGVLPAGIRYFLLDGVVSAGHAVQLAARNGIPLKAAVVGRPL